MSTRLQLHQDSPTAVDLSRRKLPCGTKGLPRRRDRRDVERARTRQAHERRGDAALQNDQPERALEEYTEAKRLLNALQEAGALLPTDRRLADIEWFLGLTQLQLGRAESAIGHYRQAMATLRLRRASLQRAALDAQIVRLEQDAATGGSANAHGSGGADGDDPEVEQIGELLQEIDARVQEVELAMQQPH